MSSLAVLDLGSNATRILIPPDLRRERVTGLGRDGFGRLGSAGMERTLAAVDEYLELAAKHGAGRVAALATSAVRDAGAAAGELLAEVRRRGVEVYVLSGEQEASLTFTGATLSLPPGTRATVVDLGGGSTEVSCGTAGAAPEWVRSFDLGSVRCTRDYERFTREDRERVRRAARETLDLPAADGRLVAVAGTAVTLAKVLAGGCEVRVDEVERLLDELEPLAPEELTARYGMPLLRAQVFRTGLAILAAAANACGRESFEVSVRDLLDGAAHDLEYEVGILSAR
jgi:exopolyphosphatase/guanosine-5'-triphosphate,3'-diphosphate pyrophosphatase